VRRAIDVQAKSAPAATTAAAGDRDAAASRLQRAADLAGQLRARPLLAQINTPTLVIAGRHDPSTTLEAGEFIAQHAANARLAVLDTAHIANIEQPQAYAETVLGFLLSSNHPPR